MDYTDLFKSLDICPLVPIVNVNNATSAGFLAEAIWNGGIRVIEVTLRTPAALSVISNMKAAVPDLKVGAGTILSQKGMEGALAAGSDFLVTPATPRSLVPALKASSVPAFPGVATPTEAVELYEAGFEYLKFFPAESCGGVSTLKAMADPLPHIRFIPTGGISADTFQDYLKIKTVIAVGGSFMIDAEALQNEDWKRIAHGASLFSETAKSLPL